MSSRMLAGTTAALAIVVVAVLTSVPGRPGAPDRDVRWLIGDLHVHVSPPDDPGHSTLTVEKAIDAARRARLDFLALTPHRADRSFDGRYGQEVVREAAAEYLATPPPSMPAPGAAAAGAPAEPASPPRPILVLAGWEYTREDPGHLGVLFTDVRALEGVAAAPRAVALGGLVVVNHPFVRPVDSDLPAMRLLKGDRRWRPFFGDAAASADARHWNAIEVWHDRSAWVQKLHAKTAAEFPDTQMVRAALAAWDAATLEQRRRITAVGGSDAHGRLPYTVMPLALTSVRVPKDTPEDGLRDALRRALLGAAVTFGPGGGSAARDFRAESDVDGERGGIGASLRVRRSVRLLWSGPATLYENGTRVGDFEDGTTRDLTSAGAFAFWRIEKPGDAYSNMIYANLEAGD